MKITKDIVSLICELEYKIASECYNPHSYNGWTDEEGCSFVYPAYYDDLEDNTKEYQARIPSIYVTDDEYSTRKIDTDNIKSLKLKMGANHLYIGKGLINVLNFLEERYNIDFNELEAHKKE